MCGIAAVFTYNGRHRCDIAGSLNIINSVQRMRGPDGEGTWVSVDGLVGLGHRRLAVIDLDDRAAQPMATVDGRVRITFNGEIYNYKELRRDLEHAGYQFCSQSDTEVLLHLYRQYGPQMTSHLRGMYAFALWDEAQKGLLLARDPFGIKPLYYANRDGVIRVASQVKALLAAGNVDTAPEPAGHVGFFLWGSVPEPFTLYKGISALPAGTSLWVQQGNSQPRLETFCDVANEIIQARFNDNNGHSDAADLFRHAIEETVNYHLVADVPVGIFLSAGLDSTSLAALVARSGSQSVRTFTLGFSEYKGSTADETPLAESVARQLGTVHTTHWVSGSDFKDDIAGLLTAMDQPSTDGVNSYFVNKAAKASGLKVALSGLGGDELLGGYPSFRHVPAITRIARPFRMLGSAFRVVTTPALRRFTSPKYAGIFELGGSLGGAYLLRRGLYMPWELPELLDADMVRQGWRDLDPIARLDQAVPTGTPPFQAVSAFETTNYMRSMLLRDTDWASMAHSLEVRVPLVDIELLRVVASLTRGATKPDKRTMARLAWLPKNVPNALLDRPKTGFTVPVRQWMQPSTGAQERGLRDWARFVYSKAPAELPSC